MSSQNTPLPKYTPVPPWTRQVAQIPHGYTRQNPVGVPSAGGMLGQYVSADPNRVMPVAQTNSCSFIEMTHPAQRNIPFSIDARDGNELCQGITHRACEGANAAVEAGGRIVERDGKLFLAAVERVEVGLYPLGDVETPAVVSQEGTREFTGENMLKKGEHFMDAALNIRGNRDDQNLFADCAKNYTVSALRVGCTYDSQTGAIDNNPRPFQPYGCTMPEVVELQTRSTPMVRGANGQLELAAAKADRFNRQFYCAPPLQGRYVYIEPQYMYAPVAHLSSRPNVLNETATRDPFLVSTQQPIFGSYPSQPNVGAPPPGTLALPQQQYYRQQPLQPPGTLALPQQQYYRQQPLQPPGMRPVYQQYGTYSPAYTSGSDGSDALSAVNSLYERPSTSFQRPSQEMYGQVQRQDYSQWDYRQQERSRLEEQRYDFRPWGAQQHDYRQQHFRPWQPEQQDCGGGYLPGLQPITRPLMYSQQNVYGAETPLQSQNLNKLSFVPRNSRIESDLSFRRIDENSSTNRDRTSAHDGLASGYAQTPRRRFALSGLEPNGDN